MMYGYMGYGHSVFGFAIEIIVWALVIGLIFRIFRGPRWHDRHMCGMREGKDALELLKERYVKGEINKSEFEEKKADLKKD